MPPHLGAAAAPSATARARRRISYKETSEDSDSDPAADSGARAAPRARSSRRRAHPAKRAASPDSDSDAFELADGQDEADDDDDDDDEAARADDTEEDTGMTSEEDEGNGAPARKRARRQAQQVGTKARSKAKAKAGAGHTVVKLARAPGKPPAPDRISGALMSFLRDLQDETNNTRKWFALHKAVYQYAWDNLQAFTMAVLPRLMAVDDTVPWLPARDMVYRIYRDIRFSKSQMPYKTNLCATFSRGGRKGEFAGYHMQFEPGNRSFAAGGRWCPNKYHLAAIRKHILDDSKLGRQLKAVVSTPEFEAYFGKAVPPAPAAAKTARGKKKAGNQTDEKGRQDPKKQPKAPKDTIVTTRQSQAAARNLFGFEDELKVAPKMDGVPNVKEHKDIAWLRLRSFLVKRDFTDDEVLQPDFIDRLVETFRVMEPLITTLNDMVYPPPTPPPSDGDSDHGEEDIQEEGEEEEEDGNEDE